MVLTLCRVLLHPPCKFAEILFLDFAQMWVFIFLLLVWCFRNCVNVWRSTMLHQKLDGQVTSAVFVQVRELGWGRHHHSHCHSVILIFLTITTYHTLGPTLFLQVAHGTLGSWDAPQENENVEGAWLRSQAWNENKRFKKEVQNWVVVTCCMLLSLKSFSYPTLSMPLCKFANICKQTRILRMGVTCCTHRGYDFGLTAAGSS